MYSAVFYGLYCSNKQAIVCFTVLRYSYIFISCSSIIVYYKKMGLLYDRLT